MANFVHEDMMRLSPRQRAARARQLGKMDAKQMIKGYGKAYKAESYPNETKLDFKRRKAVADAKEWRGIIQDGKDELASGDFNNNDRRIERFESLAGALDRFAKTGKMPSQRKKAKR